MTALGAFSAGAFLVPGRLALSNVDRLTAALAAIAFVILCTSIIRTRLFCEELLIPYESGTGFQHVLLFKRDLPRVFQPR